MPKRTENFIKLALIGMAAFGAISAYYLAANLSAKYDLIYILSFQHVPSLYFQTIIYCVVYFEVITIRRLNNEITIRKQTKMIIRVLTRFIFCEWFLYWGSFLGTYCLLGHNNFFKMGNPALGFKLFLGHLILMLILMFSILWSYNVSFPYVIIILVVALTLLYHYIFEVNIILPKYNPIFDPLYRAIHHIYL